MRTLRIPVALAMSVGALVSVSISFAGETTTTTTPPPRSTTTTTSAPYACPDNTGDRTVEIRPNSSLLQTGAGMFALSYGGSVAAGVMSDREADKRLLIPLAGPWMDLADRGCTLTSPCGEGEGFTKVLLVTSGITQGASALMMLGSLLVPEVKIVPRTANAGVKVLPMSFGSGGGIGAVGRF
jgi:hypothetical protein